MNPLDGKALASFARACLQSASPDTPELEFKGDRLVVVRLLKKGRPIARGETQEAGPVIEWVRSACGLLGSISENDLKQSRVEINLLEDIEELDGEQEEFPSRIIQRENGVLVSGIEGRGIVLPQEFQEQAMNAVQALNAACQRAGMSFKAWQEHASVFRFTAETYVD
ncbi:MAG: AMMECR1 domain-containing protein [Candidatus Woesearchaeota archaeon]